MLDQLKIGNLLSFDDFGATVSQREIAAPKKKSIKETVPFSNVTYDFSAINGELYWEERLLTYTFELLGDDPADLEYKKVNFANWVMNVMGEAIYDPFDPEYYYKGTFDSLNWDDDESVEKTTATVTFSAYPYRIARKATNFVFDVPTLSEKEIVVRNNSGHRITPAVTADTAVTITRNGAGYVFPAGTAKDDVFKLNIGMNTLTVTNATNTDCTVTISFIEEVF